MPLTDSKLCMLNTYGKHFDGGGLYLEITKAGGRYWRLRYRFAGKENGLLSGSIPSCIGRYSCGGKVWQENRVSNQTIA